MVVCSDNNFFLSQNSPIDNYHLLKAYNILTVIDWSLLYARDLFI